MLRQGALLIGTTLMLSACGGAPPVTSSGDTLVVISDSTDAGVPVLELSHTLQEVGRGEVPAIPLEPELSIGDIDGPFGMAMDVASLGDGRFAVLDRRERVSEADQIETARWSIGIRTLNSSESEKIVRRMSRSD